MFKRISILFAALAFSMTAQATLIDFTDSTWKAAIDGKNLISATVDNVTLTASGTSQYKNYLTFNDSDSGGCTGGIASSILACVGDGIGIRDDEISQGGAQEITVTFNEAVNISNIYLLDLFLNDNGVSGRTEIAFMSIDNIIHTFTADNTSNGGFKNTGFSGQNISSIIFYGNLDDTFSDYALAGIEISPVPVPGAAILFGSALLGFFGFKRRRAV